MKKDIGKKRQERAKVAKSKVLRRRKAIRSAAKVRKIEEQKERERIKLDVLSRQVMEIDNDKLNRNLEKLKEMNQEFVDFDIARKENMERIKNDTSN